MEASERTKEIEKSIIKRFRKEIWKPFVHALNEYDMIKERDNIAVCISGGKDSMVLAKCMQEILRHGKMQFGLKFLVMDPGYAPENRALIEENAKTLGIPIEIFESEIFKVVVDVEQSPCYLCARMRRGHLYAYARELGCNKIALGHHFDDVIETILMSMLYGAQVNTMMPKLHSTNFEGDGAHPSTVSGEGGGHRGLEGLQSSSLPAVRLPVHRGHFPRGGGPHVQAPGDEGVNQ